MRRCVFLLVRHRRPHSLSLHAKIVNVKHSHSNDESDGAGFQRNPQISLQLPLVSSADQELFADLEEDEVSRSSALTPSAFNLVLYGLPNLAVA